jgi:hypothetical protein
MRGGFTDYSFVGQDVILRAGCQPAPGASVCACPGPINKRPQVGNLFHKIIAAR